MNSKEHAALMRLKAPPENIRAGDMFMQERLKTVVMALGTTRASSRKRGRCWTFLYHHNAEKALWQNRQYWDSGLSGCSRIDDVISESGERYHYVGNIFEMIPHSVLLQRMQTKQ